MMRRFFALAGVTAVVLFSNAAWGQLNGAFAYWGSYQNYDGAAGSHIDLDSDGDEDLVFPSGYALGTTINGLPATFLNGPFLPLAFGAEAVRVGDVDGDGSREIVVIGTHKVAVMTMSGPTFVTNEFAHVTGVDPAGTIRLTDVDGDGDKDILLHGRLNGGQAKQILNDGNGQFTSSTSVSIGQGIGEVLVSGDFDADGDIDFATFASALVSSSPFSTTIYSTTLKVMKQTSPGSAQLVQEIPSGTFSSAQFQQAATGDFDGDGNLDLALSNNTPGASGLYITYVRNIGSGVFRYATSYQVIGPSLATGGALKVANVNNDGRDDLAVTGSTISMFAPTSRSVYVYASTPGGGMSTTFIPISTSVTYIDFVPLDSVAGLDFFATRLTQSNPPGTFLGHDIDIYASSIVQSVPPAEIVSVVRGTLAEGQFGRPLDKELVVSVRNRDGQFLANRPVTVQYPSGFPTTSGIVTDAQGFAAVSLTAGSNGGARPVQFSTPTSNTSSTEVFEIGLTTTAAGSGSNTILGFFYHFPRPGAPLLLAIDFPLPSPGFLATPYGDIFTSILSPSPTAAVLDGLGVFLPPDPTMVTSPNWFRSATVPNAWLQANTFIVQMYGYDYTKPFPEGLLISNPITL